jgi:hypothetical protein
MDLMIDIETLDTENRAAVISIGAIVFDTDARHVEERTFHVNIDFEQAIRYGSVSESTVQFWERQPKEAVSALFDPDPVDLRTALSELNTYIYSWPKKPKYIWGNSPSFDVAILRHAYKQHELKFPFLPWFEMDVRTIKNLLKKDEVPKKTGVNHHPIDDCLWQCEILWKYFEVPFDE